MFGDNDSPIMGSFLKALQIKDYLERSSYERERREQEREQYKLAMEDRKRAQALQNFQTALTLHQMYARPLSESDLKMGEALDAGVFGPVAPDSRRPTVNTPIGAYALPSRLDTAEREKAAKAQQAADEVDRVYARKAADKRAEQEDLEANGIIVKLPLGENGALKEVKVSRAEAIQLASTLNSQRSDPKIEATARLKARRRVNEKYSGAHREELIQDYAKGIYQTIAQQRGITWQTERDQEIDPNARAMVSEAMKEARERAEAQLKADLQALEDKYTDEELTNGEAARPSGKSSPTKPPVATQSKPDPKKQTGHEQYYKDNYDFMTPAERADFERRFQTSYGRAPQR